MRVHSECLTGDVFALAALRLRAAAARGDAADRRGRPRRRRLPVRARGPGDRHRPQAAGLRAAGRRASTPSTPTSSSACPSTTATTAIGAAILHDLGVASVVLLTNNPAKTSSLTAAGIAVVGPPAAGHRRPRRQRGLPAHQAGAHGPPLRARRVTVGAAACATRRGRGSEPQRRGEHRRNLVPRGLRHERRHDPDVEGLRRRDHRPARVARRRRRPAPRPRRRRARRVQRRPPHRRHRLRARRRAGARRPRGQRPRPHRRAR